MTLKDQLDLLVKYEQVDAPTNPKERYAWRMYVAQKITDFLGEEKLKMELNLHHHSTQTPHMIIAKQLQ